MNRMTFSTGKVVALGVAIAVALLAMAPGKWVSAQEGYGGQTTATPTATPLITVIENPGAQEVSTTVSGTDTATVGSNADGSVSLSIPAASMPGGSTVTVTQPPFIHGESLLEGGGTVEIRLTAYMNLEAVDSNGDPITEFDEPVTLRVNIADTAWAIAKQYGSPTVKVRNRNQGTGEVTTVTCDVIDAEAGIVECELPHFSEWDVLIAFSVPEGTDLADLTPGSTIDGDGGGEVTPRPADTGAGVFDATPAEGGSNMGVLLGAAAALAVAGGLGARFAARRARA